MDSSKKDSRSRRLTCDICKIDFMTDADHALHEFSKRHCDNLLRISRNKQVVTKPKPKPEPEPEPEPDWGSVEKELVPKPNVLPQTGSFAKYGYFIPGEIYKIPTVSKEFNTDYDPYLQKFAENPCKEKAVTLPKADESENQTVTFNMPTTMSKKKRKKIKICQICNVMLSTGPEYDSHMKSPQHIWKLKTSGMGVSAHFVKASSDLHTTDTTEEVKVNQDVNSQLLPIISGSNENVPASDFPSLFCDVCELLLNSIQQYNSHVNGKTHIECVQRKAELKARKEKLQNPSPNQLYCYSCKITLNNLVQYNEHKNGKKHKIKCKQLMKEGITIPPEERLPGWTTPKNSSNKPVVYPELYEKFVLEKEKPLEPSPVDNFSVKVETLFTENGSENLVSKTNSTNVEFACNSDLKNSNFSSKSINTNNETGSNIIKIPSIVFHKEPKSERSRSESAVTNSDEEKALEKICDSLPNSEEKCAIVSPNQTDLLDCKPKMEEDNKLVDAELVVLAENDLILCNICNQSFQTQSQFDVHANTEDHMKQILQQKIKGRNINQILNLILSNRNIIKPDKLGRYNCSVCNVISNNVVEYKQHVNSIVHKYTLKDYKQKRTVEIKNMVESNEQGLYFCPLCNEAWKSLLEYSQHLHLIKHRSTQRVEKAKKKILFLRKQRLRNNLKRKTLAQRRLKIDKNPGVRTKICGIATDIHTGAQASIPNLEPLEPKIDLSKNVQLGVSEKCNGSKFKDEDRKKKLFKAKKHRHKKFHLKGNQRQAVISKQNFIQNNLIPSLMSSPIGNALPPPAPPFQPPHFTYPGPFRSMPCNWPPNRPQYPHKPGFSYGSPPQVNNNHFLGQPWNYRIHRPRYSPSYR